MKNTISEEKFSAIVSKIETHLKPVQTRRGKNILKDLKIPEELVCLILKYELFLIF